jgi:rhodanese-related sulfurtransferase/glyoxylase-like metal-dependent hydrolase (beta-lactamase superfamily II)
MKRVAWLIPVLSFLGLDFSAGAALQGDAEAASHGDEAASLQVVAETAVREPDFIFRQYNLGVLSHYSYLLASGGEALVVDPARDIKRYLKDAAELGVKITRIYLTHSHADFVAGHTELAKATGAAILVNKATGAGYPHQPLEDGSTIRFGAIRGQVLTTPGHTPDGTCLLIFSPAESTEPRLLLTGDTLFIGSMGRPDLMGGTVPAAALAAMAYDSWTRKLAGLPDALRFFPAHGAGSLCGAHLSDSPVSTIGEQKKVNPYLRFKDRNSFIMSMISGLPDAPPYFGHNARMNHDGPPLVDGAAGLPPALEPADVQKQEQAGAWVVDLRDGKLFAAGHAARSINIGLRGRFETWVGIMIPWGAPLILAGPEADVREAAFRLHRVGYDALAGYLKGGVEAWARAGLPVNRIDLVEPADLRKQIQAGTAPLLVDVRLPSEWMGLRITDNLLNYPLNTLARDSLRLDKAMPVMTICNSAYRSSMGASVLLREGFAKAVNLDGGSEAWITAGFPTVGATPPPGGAAVPAVYVNLPEPVSPSDLSRRLMDLPGSLDVVDIRPAWQFEEYHLPGAAHVPVDQVMNNPAFLVDKRPLVLVCRDGSISASVAGALVQKGSRPIRFLLGGMARYHDEVQRPAGLRSESVPLNPAALPAVQAPSAPQAPSAVQPASPAPAPAKKKSAGC